MNKSLKKYLRIPVISLIIIVLILALTNPSMKSFKEFGGGIFNKNEQRVKNYLIFSVYQRDEFSGIHTLSAEGVQYIGILLNFYRK
jgi:hypothetical protein